jgi:TolB-like protein/Tfp pilus assembly protein PilF
VVAIAAVLVVITGLAFWRSGGDTGAGGVTAKRPSIVVLPLNNLSGTEDDDYFADGMTDELITSLAKIKGLRVISRTSAMRVKEANRTVPEIAEQLGVDYVLEGSVLRADGRVRINAQLIDTAQDRSVWAENYDHDFQDILSLQNDAARTIAGEIRVQLSPEEQVRLGASPKISPQAYENYLRARFFMNRRSREGVVRAKELFQEVINAEPDSGMGYAGLADAHVLTAVQGYAPPQQVWPEAKAAAERAVELDANLADAHASLGLIRSFYEWDWKNAAQEFDRAIELNPGYVTARQRRATYLSRLGRHDEAIEEIQRAREIDPLSLSVSHSAGVIYSMAREHNMAVEQFKNNLELAGDYYRTYMALGRCQLETRDFAAGLASLNRASELSGHNPFVVATLAFGYGRSGDQDEARKLLKQLEEQSTSRYVSPVSLAMVQIGLGETDAAFALLDKALKERSGFLSWLKVEPAFDPLRDDPRFVVLLDAVGFGD